MFCKNKRLISFKGMPQTSFWTFFSKKSLAHKCGATKTKKIKGNKLDKITSQSFRKCGWSLSLCFCWWNLKKTLSHFGIWNTNYGTLSFWSKLFLWSIFLVKLTRKVWKEVFEQNRSVPSNAKVGPQMRWACIIK